MVSYNFSGSGADIVNNFSEVTVAGRTANDATIQVINNTVVLNSQVYQNNSIFSEYFFDPRLVLYYNTTLPSQLMSLSAIVSNKQYYNNLSSQFLNSLGITDPSIDYNLCLGALSTLDNNGCTYDFAITDNMLYVIVERIPVYRTSSNNYYAYTYSIPTIPIQPNQKLLLQVIYNPASGMTWYANNKVVFNLPPSQIGMGLPQEYTKYQSIDLGGTPQNVTPSTFNVGFDNVMLVDGLPPNWTMESKAIMPIYPYTYYYPGTNIPMKFIYPDRYEYGLFGQGNVLTVYEAGIHAYSSN